MMLSEDQKTMTSDEILKVKGVSKHFGKIIALESITFEVKKGEFVFITGPSGSGKTTLLRLILREFLPDSGEIIFEGINLNGVSRKEIPSLRQKIGVVFQDFKVLPERTVRENVEIALAVKGIEENEWKARVDQVLKLVGLLTRADLFPRQLSGGELQRLSLARALIVNPDLVLADEPTGNLDWDTSESLMDLFNKINEEGKTIIMSTHNRMIVNKLKKREIKLKEGQIETLKEVEPEVHDKPKAKIKVKVEEV
jgi:cell division transport system ATP-binding protein